MKNAIMLVLSLGILLPGFCQDKTVLLDSYFNNEYKKDASGQMVSFHYKWDETGDVGYSKLSDLFTKNGAKTATLREAPSRDNLESADLYIIVDPDTYKENPNPVFIGKKDIKAITKWVKKGGVLVMLANDSANTELPHFNELAARFGMHFNDQMINHVINDQHFEDGGISNSGNPVFLTSKKLFMKDACSISITGAAYPVLKNKEDIIIAATPYGKGTVVAIGDPWLYNEYVNGRLPKDFENDKAAEDLVKWLLSKIP